MCGCCSNVRTFPCRGSWDRTPDYSRGRCKNQRPQLSGVQDLFMNDVFRVYTSPDMLGMELGGSLKNVIALAAGMADGLGYGDNTKAALITRGITEIARLAVAMGAHVETLCGADGNRRSDSNL